MLFTFIRNNKVIIIAAHDDARAAVSCASQQIQIENIWISPCLPVIVVAAARGICTTHLHLDLLKYNFSAFVVVRPSGISSFGYLFNTNL